MQQIEEEELRSLVGAGVNKVSVRRTSVAKPHVNGVGCNTTSPLKGVDLANNLVGMVAEIIACNIWYKGLLTQGRF